MVAPRRTSLPIAVICAAIVLLLVVLPYVYASLAAGTDYVFGGFLLNPMDGNSYFAKMIEGWRGEWRFTLPYTAEPGQGAYVFLLYLFLGHLARWTGLPVLVVFHLARLLAALLMLVVLYRFYRLCLPEPRQHNLAFILACLGSGLGWLAAPLGGFTSDFWVAETYPFLTAYVNPHFPLSLALVLILLLPWNEKGDGLETAPGRGLTWRGGLAYALLALLLAVVNPFGVVVTLVVLGGLAFWAGWSRSAATFGRARWISLPYHGLVSEAGVRCLWVLLGSGLPMLYSFWVLNSDPVLAGWTAQNLTPSPPWWDLLLSLSPVLFLALPGAWWVWKCRLYSPRLFLVWSGLGLLLLYLPFGLQRRFMMGLYVPLAGLAAVGLEGLAARTGKRLRFWALPVLLLALPTNLMILLTAVIGAQTHDPMLYMTAGEAQAMAWLRTNTPEQALVLGGPGTGLLIPAWTGRRVIYGHPFETVNAVAEEQAVLGFFDHFDGPPTPAGMAPGEFLKLRQVDFVFSGPREGVTETTALEATGLTPVYSAAGVTIYGVKLYAPPR